MVKSLMNNIKRPKSYIKNAFGLYPFFFRRPGGLPGGRKTGAIHLRKLAGLLFSAHLAAYELDAAESGKNFTGAHAGIAVGGVLPVAAALHHA